MIEEEFVIKNKLGLHMKPATKFVQLVSKYKSSVMVIKDDETADGKSYLGLLTLAIQYNDKIKIIVDGEDEKELMEAVRDLINHNFYESEDVDMGNK